MDLTCVKWRGEISCAKFSRGVRAGDLGSKLGSSYLTCSSSTCSFEGDLREASKISSGWVQKSKGGLWAIIEGICDSFGKISKIEEVVREEWKWENSTKKHCSQKTTFRETWRWWETWS